MRTVSMNGTWPPQVITCQQIVLYTNQRLDAILPPPLLSLFDRVRLLCFNVYRPVSLPLKFHFCLPSSCSHSLSCSPCPLRAYLTLTFPLSPLPPQFRLWSVHSPDVSVPHQLPPSHLLRWEAMLVVVSRAR